MRGGDTCYEQILKDPLIPNKQNSNITTLECRKEKVSEAKKISKT